MKLPVDLLNIGKWKAFKGSFNKIDGIHRIIIFYENNGSYYFFCITSQIEKAKIRSREDLSSLVEISKKEWLEVLTKNSCVECGKRNIKKITTESLKKMYEENKLQVLGDVPKSIREKIIKGICHTITYTDTEKAIFTNNERK